MFSSGLRAKKAFVLGAIGLAVWYPCYWLLSVSPTDLTLTLTEPRLNPTSSALVGNLELDSHSLSPDTRSQSQLPSELNDSRPAATILLDPIKQFMGRPSSLALTRQYNVTSHAMWDEGLWQEFVRYSSSPSAPYVNILLATWRTGSTFIGKMIVAHPGSFYHFEPMHGLGLHQVRDGAPLEDASSRLLQLAHCNISAEYAESSRVLLYGLQNSAPWVSECGGSISLRNASHWCWDTEFLRDLCQIHPYQLIKTVRVRLHALQLLLQDSPNARVVVLGRDPRATKHSRRKPLFCKRREPLCDDPGLCSDMVKDYYTAVTYETLFPGRVRLLRYEDLVEEPMEQFKKLTNFYSLKLTKAMLERIKKNMNGTAMVFKEPEAAPKIPKYRRVPYALGRPQEDVSAHTTVRDSKFEATEWRLEMQWQDVVNIQNECEEAMNLWGYNNALSEDQLKTFEPTGAFTNNIKL